MRKRTNAEIEMFLKTRWPDLDYDFEIRQGADYVDIDIADMYSAPGLSFADLKEMAKFFGTENINDAETYSGHGGCETCDYGSKRGFTLRVK